MLQLCPYRDNSVPVLPVLWVAIGVNRYDCCVFPPLSARGIYDGDAFHCM